MELLRGGACFRHYWTNVLTQHHKGSLSSLASALLCIGCFQAGSRPQSTMISGVVFLILGSLPMHYPWKKVLIGCALRTYMPMDQSRAGEGGWDTPVS